MLSCELVVEGYGLPVKLADGGVARGRVGVGDKGEPRVGRGNVVNVDSDAGTISTKC